MKKALTICMTLLTVMMLTSCTWDRRDTGTAVGAVAGGVIGNAVTGGSAAGTIIGAVGGGYVGGQVAK